MKGIIKDTEEQPDEKIHRVRSGKVSSTDASVLVELGCAILPACDVFTNSGAFQTLYLRDFYGGFIT